MLPMNPFGIPTSTVPVSPRRAGGAADARPRLKAKFRAATPEYSGHRHPDQQGPRASSIKIVTTPPESSSSIGCSPNAYGGPKIL